MKRSVDGPSDRSVLRSRQILLVVNIMFFITRKPLFVPHRISSNTTRRQTAIHTPSLHSLSPFIPSHQNNIANVQDSHCLLLITDMYLFINRVLMIQTIFTVNRCHSSVPGNSASTPELTRGGKLHEILNGAIIK